MNKTLLFVTTLLLVTCSVCQLGFAQTPTTTARRGFKIEYSNLLPNAETGQAPLRVQITRVPAVPSASDESFNVSLTSDRRYNSNSSSFSAEFVLPAGKTSAEVELLFDQGQNYHSLIVERGRTHTDSRGDDLYNQRIDVNVNRGGGLPGQAGTWLLISSKAPKIYASGKTWYPGQPLGNNTNTTYSGSVSFNQSFRGDKKIPGLKKIFGQPLGEILNRGNWQASQPADLPQTWVGLSSINYILISNDEFKSLTKVPAYRQIMEQWVAAGGCLVVFNAKNSLAHADSIFPALLGLERAKPPRGWAAVSSTKSESPIQNTRDPTFRPASELIAKNKAAFSPYLNGMVVAMVSPERLPNSFNYQHFRNPRSIGFQAARDVGLESPIPGVGKPPIALFGVFTGLFLFLIGPVILVIVTLNNSRRFLFFMVPVFSFITCTGILGYAIIADFNKQLGRTDTITALDSRSGFAYSNAYSAYYCGSQPSYYAYDTDTLIQTTVLNGGYRIRHLADENRLSSPRIQPRKSHEVFTARPYPTQQRFLVAESADKPNVPEVTNLLGGRIERASFEYRGKSYIVRDLEPKQTALGIEQSFNECRKELRQAVADRQTRGGSAVFRSASSRISLAINQQETRDFAAILNVNPAIDPLIEPFDYKLQLHVVHGKY